MSASQVTGINWFSSYFLPILFWIQGHPAYQRSMTFIQVVRNLTHSKYRQQSPTHSLSRGNVDPASHRFSAGAEIIMNAHSTSSLLPETGRQSRKAILISGWHLTVLPTNVFRPTMTPDHSTWHLSFRKRTCGELWSTSINLVTSLS